MADISQTPGNLTTSVDNSLNSIKNSNVVSAVSNDKNALAAYKNTSQYSGDTSERLFKARPRYARQDQTYITESNGTVTNIDAAGSRGDWAYIKLITSKEQEAGYLSGNTRRDIKNKDSLIGRGSVVSDMVNPNTGAGYDRFLITSVSCQMSEKVQITEVFGDSEVVYYFGRQPLIFNIGGLLIDSADNDWFYTWLNTYSEFLRGTQTARNYELLKIVLPNMILTGTMSGFAWSQDASRDTDIAFNFQFIAKIVEPRPAQTGAMVNSNKIRGVNFSKVAAFTSQKQINDLKGQINSLSSVIQNPQSSLKDRSLALNKLGTGVGGSFGAFLEASKGTLDGVKSTTDGWSTSVLGAATSVRTSALFQTVTSSLNGIRANLFSPVYGILSSLTKLVSNTFNSVNSIFNSLINPVRTILRDITNISRQAIALVNLVNSSIVGVGRNVNSQLRGVKQDYKTAIKTLKKAAGTIAAAPISAAQSVKVMFNSGALNAGSAFLTSTPKIAFVRPSINITGKKPPTRLSLLAGTAEYLPKTANEL